jgi:hypothetical protein
MQQAGNITMQIVSILLNLAAADGPQQQVADIIAAGASPYTPMAARRSPTDATGYLLWSSAGGGKAPDAGSKVPPAAPGNSSSSSLILTWGKPLSSRSERLRLLAAAASAQWSEIKRLGGPINGARWASSGSDREGACLQLSEMLVLLVQQLQREAPNLHAAFLRSPAGGSVLRVLSEMTSAVDAREVGLALVLPDRPLRAAAAAEQGVSAPTQWCTCAMTWHDLVDMLVQPGLLLRPASASQPSGGAAGRSSGNEGIRSFACHGQASSSTTAASGCSSSQCVRNAPQGAAGLGAGLMLFGGESPIDEPSILRPLKCNKQQTTRSNPPRSCTGVPLIALHANNPAAPWHCSTHQVH